VLCFCFSSSCVPILHLNLSLASFSGLSLLIAPSVLSNVYLHWNFLKRLYYTGSRFIRGSGFTCTNEFRCIEVDGIDHLVLDNRVSWSN
jgi:hypothetical protein